MCQETAPADEQPVLLRQPDATSSCTTLLPRGYLLKRREVLLIELGWIEEALGMPRTKPPRARGT